MHIYPPLVTGTARPCARTMRHVAHGWARKKSRELDALARGGTRAPFHWRQRLDSGRVARTCRLRASGRHMRMDARSGPGVQHSAGTKPRQGCPQTHANSALSLVLPEEALRARRPAI